MAVLPLVQLQKDDFFTTETGLRSPSRPVSDFGNEFQRLVDDLIDTLMTHEIAVGLAAPQVGVSSRVAVVNLKTPDFGPTLVIVNPEIRRTWGKKDVKKESCMSLPHVRGEVQRRYKIAIEYQDRHGETKKAEETGFFARVLAHEIDHLNGVLYIDRMPDSAILEAVDFFDT